MSRWELHPIGPRAHWELRLPGPRAQWELHPSGNSTPLGPGPDGNSTPLVPGPGGNSAPLGPGPNGNSTPLDPGPSGNSTPLGPGTLGTGPGQRCILQCLAHSKGFGRPSRHLALYFTGLGRPSRHLPGRSPALYFAALGAFQEPRETFPAFAGKVSSVVFYSTWCIPRASGDLPGI